MRRSSSRLPGYARLLVGRNRVDVGRRGGERQLDAVANAPLALERREQLLHALGALALQHVVERFEPFGRLGRIDVVRNRRILFGNVGLSHVASCMTHHARIRDTEDRDKTRIRSAFLSSHSCISVSSCPFALILFALRSIDFGRRAEINLAGKGQGFAERRVGVDRVGDVADRAAHFDRDDGFGDQLAGADADDAAAEDAVGSPDR